MNEMKKRVTNEQAVAIRDNVIKTRLLSNIYTDDIAADLIESRELAENQKELIKEMRAIISNAMSYGIYTDCHCDNCNRARGLLEQTKDYA